MPQLDPSTFSPQLIWLAISFAILYVLMAKVALPRISMVLEERKEKIEDNLDTAEELRTAARADHETYERALSTAREQARGAIQEAVAAAAAEAQEKHEQLGERLGQQIKSAEAEIETAKQNARASVRDAAVGVAQAATERLIGVLPSEDAASAAVDRALEGRS